MNLSTRFSLRLNTINLYKLREISDNNKRSINNQIDTIIDSFIKKYEEVNGKIDISKYLNNSENTKLD